MPPPFEKLVESTRYQLLTCGRINLDLYVEDLGRRMRDADTFVASVGGSPTNTAIVATNLGVRAAVLSATGDDYAADLVLHKLETFGVCTDLIVRDPRGATSLALLATVASDVGERQFYRENPADIYLDPAMIGSVDWTHLAAVALSADALAAGTTPTVVRALAVEARRRHVAVWWDLDLRHNSWGNGTEYAAVVPAFVHPSDLVIGTEEEFAAFFGLDPRDLEGVERAVECSDLRTVVLKRGPLGVSLYRHGDRVLDVPSLSSAPVCTVGGGDSAAGALIAARCAGYGWADSLGLAMRAAAWTVEQPYCSSGFPTASTLGLQPLIVPDGDGASV